MVRPRSGRRPTPWPERLVAARAQAVRQVLRLPVLPALVAQMRWARCSVRWDSRRDNWARYPSPRALRCRASRSRWLPQQVMQGVQQIVEKATQAGEPKDADAAQARDEARPGETATGGRAPNQDNQHRETSPRAL